MARPVGWFRRSALWPIGTQIGVAATVVLLVVVVLVVVRALPSDPANSDTVIGLADLPPASNSGHAPEPLPGSPVVAASPPSTATLNPEPTTSTAATTAALVTTTVLVDPVRSDRLATLDVLYSIPIELEHRVGYDRALFAVWSDLDGDGCDTREEVLIDESLSPVQLDLVGCTIVAGDWYSPYDGETFTDPGGIDIDHVVSLKEAWDSGAWAWTTEQRTDYGNDVSDHRTLVAVSAESNRAKGDADPSNWLPAPAHICTFVEDWIAIKARWSMSMDQTEWGRLKNLLTSQCIGVVIHPRPVPA